MHPKIGIMLGACILANAVVGNLPDTDKVDPEISGDAVKVENTYAYRIAHIFFGGLQLALDPSYATHWETRPWLEEASAKAEAGGPLGSLAETLLPALTSFGGPALTDLLKGLLAGKTPVAVTTKPGTLDAALGTAK